MSPISPPEPRSGLSGRDRFSHERVAHVSDFIAFTGAVRLVEKWRVEDGFTPSGPKHVVSDHAVLVLMQLLVGEYNAFSIHEAAKAVMNRLPADSLELLDLAKAKPASRLVWEQRVRRALERVTCTFDPYIGNKHVRLSIDGAIAEHKRRKNDPLHATKQKRIDEFSDCLTFGFLDFAVPQSVQTLYKGNFTIDGTSLPIVGKWAGHQPSRDSAAVDVDAHWWGRGGNHFHAGMEAPDDEGKSRTSMAKFGYEADLLMWTTNDPTKEAEFPLICPVVRVKRPGHRTGQLALDMVQTHARRGLPTRMLISDGAVAPGSAPENLQHGLFDLGVDICVHPDKKKKGRKISGYQGLIWVDGNPYCEAMPRGLVEATSEFSLDGTEAERRILFKRLLERKRYLAKPNGKPNAKGAVQYLHPTEKGRHVCNPDRPGAPPFCRQRSILVPRESLELKYRQRLSYLSAEWARLHFAGRSSIEGFNGILKNRNRTAADEPRRVPVRGYAAKYLATTMMVIATNDRIVENFANRTEESSFVAQKRREKRREGTWSAAYHDPQFWLDLSTEEFGSDSEE